MKKRIIIATIVALIAMVLVVTPAYAIALPDSTPTVESIHAFQHILEDDDMLIIIKENTPYTTPPDTPYDDAFIWRMYDTDGTTELAQATGYPYNDNGYGYNIISFYFSASDAPTWGQNYYFRLVGTPTAFSSPPTYNFQMDSSAYSDETITAVVKAAIATLVIQLADQLNTDWGLDSDDYLTEEAEVWTVLSLNGEAFFRGAIYGIQSMAEGAFSVSIYQISVDDRTWTDNYSSALSTQLAGTDIGNAMDAGNTMLDSDYNLYGLIGIIVVCGGFIGACIWVGGDIWGSLAVATGLAIIGTRMGLMDLVTLGLIAAMAWLFFTGKMWKVF